MEILNHMKYEENITSEVVGHLHTDFSKYFNFVVSFQAFQNSLSHVLNQTFTLMKNSLQVNTILNANSEI